jgi:hypothetical protein
MCARILFGLQFPRELLVGREVLVAGACAGAGAAAEHLLAGACAGFLGLERLGAVVVVGWWRAAWRCI